MLKLPNCHWAEWQLNFPLARSIKCHVNCVPHRTRLDSTRAAAAAAVSHIEMWFSSYFAEQTGWQARTKGRGQLDSSTGSWVGRQAALARYTKQLIKWWKHWRVASSKREMGMGWDRVGEQQLSDWLRCGQVRVSETNRLHTRADYKLA